jgi:hypothetical protein
MPNTKAVGVAYLDPEFQSVQLTGITVGQLPPATVALLGTRGTVTDSNAATTAGIGAVVAAGGANVVPVYCDGAAWRIA